MHHHDHRHHSHIDPAFELAESDCHQCGEHSAPHFNIECGHEHRIFGVNITHKPGDFIYWDSELELYVPAVEDKCDLMVLRVDRYGTWFEAANIGEFQLKNFTLKGPVYIDYVGELTNTLTNTKVGFIENGHLYLSIEHTVRGVAGPQGPQGPQGDPASYTLPIASSSVLGGVKVGNNLSIDVDGTLNAIGGDSIFARGTGLNSLLAQIDPVADSNIPPTANGDYSLAIGANAVSGGLSSFAFGGYLLNLVDEPVSALGDYSFAFGKNVSVDDTSNYSSGFGSNNQIVNSPFSKVFGENSSITNSGKTVAYGGANTVTSSFYSMVIGSTNTASGLINSLVVGFENTLTNGNTSVIMASQQITAPEMSNSVVLASQSVGLSANGVYSSIISAYSLTATSAMISDSILKITGSTTLNYNVQKSFIFGNSLTSTAAISESFIFGNSHSIGDSGNIAIFGGSHQIGDSCYYSAAFGTSNKILNGSGYSLISGNDNKIDHYSYYSAILGGCTNVIDTNSYYSAIVAGMSNILDNSSYYSNILGGGYNTIDHGSYNSAIVAGMSNILDNSSYYSVIAGGFGNQMNKSYYGFISGQSNKIQQNLSSGNASWYSGILSGTNNTITEGTGCSIIASSSSTITTAYQSSIIASSSSTITTAYKSSIISGSQNTITGNGSDTLEATVVSGYGNSSGYAYQFIMGKFNDNKADSVLEIGWGTYSTHANIFRITNQGVSEQAGLILKHLASNPSTIVDGQMFTKADGLYVQINGVLYKVNLTVA